jgi:tetratricopeptide (TPR) repeat protein
MDQERMARAVALRESGRLEEASREFRAMADATEEFEEQGGLLLEEARALLALGRRTEAERAVREADRALASDSPQRPEVVFLLAEVESRDSREGARRALIRLERLLDGLAPRSAAPGERAAYARAQTRRAELLASLGRRREARALFEEALATETPKDGRFFYEFGRTCYRLGEYPRAGALLAEALARDLDPKRRLEAHYHAGIIQVRRGAYPRAVHELSHCETGEQSAGRLENVLLWLAWLSAQLGQKEEAEEYLCRAEACRPDEPRWRRSLRRLVYRLQRRGLALALHSRP